MRRNLFASGLVLLTLVGLSVAAFAASGVTLEGVKCILVAKNDAKEANASKWKEGKVFFCCKNCLGKFDKMDDEAKGKLASKANHQLVATKQYEQEVCPFTGGKLNAETAIAVSGAKVAFCCNNCKGKAEKLEGEEQLTAVFGEEAFKKGKFKPVKHEE